MGALRGRRTIYDRVVEAESPYPTMQHHILNMHFEVSGDRATGGGYVFFVGVADEEQAQNPYAMGGSYEWEYVKEDAGWRLKRQRLGVWWTQGRDAISAFDEARANAERRRMGSEEDLIEDGGDSGLIATAPARTPWSPRTKRQGRNLSVLATATG